ncbi:MAG: hypothetical protein WBM86_29215, partial [Waterburya sp.]
YRDWNGQSHSERGVGIKELSQLPSWTFPGLSWMKLYLIFSTPLKNMTMSVTLEDQMLQIAITAITEFLHKEQQSVIAI